MFDMSISIDVLTFYKTVIFVNITEIQPIFSKHIKELNGYRNGIVFIIMHDH